jgi:hypothetical protein
MKLKSQHKENLIEYIANTNINQITRNFNEILKVYDIQIEYFYSSGNYTSALQYTIDIHEKLKSIKCEEKEIVMNQFKKFLRLRKEMIKCWNIFALKHLEKNENEKAKHYLDLIDKYEIEDYSSYVTTKTNLSCYYNNTNHFRNSKSTMFDIKRINIMKKLNDYYKETACDINFEKKNNIKEDSKSKCTFELIIAFNYSDIALDFHNICSIQSKLKKYSCFKSAIMMDWLKVCNQLHLTNLLAL